jgi:hypothetical protein
VCQRHTPLSQQLVLKKHTNPKQVVKISQSDVRTGATKAA